MKERAFWIREADLDALWLQGRKNLKGAVNVPVWGRTTKEMQGSGEFVRVRVAVDAE